MTIGKQIGISLGGMIAACAVIGAAGWWSLITISRNLDESVGVTTRNIELAGELKANVLTFRLQERGMLLFSFIKADAQTVSCRDNFDKAMSAALAKVSAIRALPHSDRASELINQAEAQIKDYRTEQLVVRKLLAARQVIPATEYDKKMLVAAGGKIMASLEQFSDLMHGLNAQTNEDALRVKTEAKTALGLGLLLFALLVSLAIVAVRRATRSLQVTTADLRLGAEEVASAAAQVSTSSQTLAQGCTQQAAWLEETSSSSEQINAMTRINSDKARSAAGLVTQSQQAFSDTDRLLQQTVAAMKELDEQSGKISSVIKVIEGIAFQTNILALNAAVEAARAGNAGLGFAVVADEVRNLAGRCAQAAKDTSALIEESIAKSQGGKSKVDQVVSAIHKIMGQAATVKELVDEMNTGGQEQARGAEHIGQALIKIEKVTEQTAAGAEQGAAAAQQLTAQSQTFKSIVERLNTLVGSH